MARLHVPFVETTLTLPARRFDARTLVVTAAAAATLLPWVSPAVALAGGVVLALACGNPFPERARVVSQKLLALSVMLLGAGMDLGVVLHVGARGIGVAAIGIACALAGGALLGRVLGVSRHASTLVSLGTAICGGSAIAAGAPAIGAKAEDVSVALVTVFVLNAVALFLFPAVGHALGLDPTRFGMWCALAIHDTSSVIGAAASYGGGALEIATAAKLARALWIVPVTLGLAALRARPAGDRAAPKRPWFIAGFLLAAAIVTALPALRPIGSVLVAVAHRGLALTLFLVGLGLTRPALRAVGVRPFVQGAVLWVALAGATLFAITRGLCD